MSIRYGRCRSEWGRTLDPFCIHLNNLIDELDGLAAFALRLADLLCISTLAVYETCYVERHDDQRSVSVTRLGFSMVVLRNRSWVNGLFKMIQ